jgi:hypothetical protein
MSNVPEKQINQLPTLQELYEGDVNLLFKNEQFNLLMSQKPNEKWIKENKFAGNSKYIPVGVIETLLQRIFKCYRVEILREGTAFNSVYVTVRLHYTSPVTGNWEFHDGIGAVQLQVKQGSSAAQLENINNNAVMMAFPMAKSYALKDAAEHIGAIFGRDLNRKDTMVLTPNVNNSIHDDKEKIRLENRINACANQLEIQALDYTLVQKYNLQSVYNDKMISYE